MTKMFKFVRERFK